MNKKIEIYQSKDGQAQVEVKFEKETIWIDAHLIAALFNVKRPAIVKHINNIYKSREILKDSTCSILEQVAADENFVVSSKNGYFLSA